MIKALGCFYAFLLVSYLLITQSKPLDWMLISICISAFSALLEDSIKTHITKTMEQK